MIRDGWREFGPDPPLPPDRPGQVDIFWFSPGWATFIRGLFNRYPDGGWALVEYAPQEDRFYEWHPRLVPKYWMLAPNPVVTFAEEHAEAFKRVAS